ncbi:MAG: type II toxin-antitoxin system HicA family toxin [Janthinobacterium lividum]
MKRLELVRYLLAKGCVLVREGHDHTVFRNPANGLQSVLGRHREIDNLMARKICRQLGIDPML